MTHRRIARAAAGVVAITAGQFGLWIPDASPAGAQDKPAEAARDVAREFAAARRLMDARQWREAGASLRAILGSVPGDPAVLAILPEIEDALRTAGFRESWRGVDLRSELGKSCVDYVPGTRYARFETRPSEEGWGWVSDGGGAAIFDRPLEGDVAIEFAWLVFDGSKVVQPPALVLAWDSEARTGYCAVLGVARSPGGSTFAGTGSIIRSAGRDRTSPIGKSGSALLARVDDRTTRMRFERRGVGLIFTASGAEVARASDAAHRSGAVGIISGDAGLPPRVSISGRLTESWVRRTTAQAENAARRAFEAKWNRAKELPHWILAREADALACLTVLPPDGRPEQRLRLASAIGDAWDRRAKSLTDALRSETSLGPATRVYLEALAAYAAREEPVAEPRFAALAALAPGFAPAHAGRGLSLFSMSSPDAGAHLSTARRLDPHFPPLVESDALRALHSGDASGAAGILARAVSAGADSPGMRRAIRIVHRARFGPRWVRRFEFETDHFRIASDHSVSACGDVGKMLEDARAAYTRHFRPPGGPGKAQVLVFSGEDDFHEYARDLGFDLDGASGVYLPGLTQLAVYLHDDRASLIDTVRHEGFHQYLHAIVRSPPIWFDEGHAEYFGFSRRRLGRTILGEADGIQRQLVSLLRKGFTPLREFLLMPQAEFLAKPEIHYVQAWTVVHLLRETKDPRLAGVLDRLLASMEAGRNGRTAFAEVIEPVFFVLAAEWSAHLDQLERTR